jgi:hypothetical protein
MYCSEMLLIMTLRKIQYALAASRVPRRISGTRLLCSLPYPKSTAPPSIGGGNPHTSFDVAQSALAELNAEMEGLLGSFDDDLSDSMNGSFPSRDSASRYQSDTKLSAHHMYYEEMALGESRVEAPWVQPVVSQDEDHHSAFYESKSLFSAMPDQSPQPAETKSVWGDIVVLCLSEMSEFKQLAGPPDADQGPVYSLASPTFTVDAFMQQELLRNQSQQCRGVIVCMSLALLRRGGAAATISESWRNYLAYSGRSLPVVTVCYSDGADAGAPAAGTEVILPRLTHRNMIISGFPLALSLELARSAVLS